MTRFAIPEVAFVLGAAATLFIYGCAQSKEAASPQSAPASTPAEPNPNGAVMDESTMSREPVSAQSAPNTAPSPAAAPPSSDRRREAALRSARAELDTASRELDLATGECGSACRALASMERATGHMCNLASDESDRRRCEEAKAKVARARDRIRSSCGTCPDGTRLDRSP